MLEYERRQIVINHCCKALAIAVANGKRYGIHTVIRLEKHKMRPFLEAIATTRHGYIPGLLAKRILRRFNYLDGLDKVLEAANERAWDNRASQDVSGT